MSDVVGGRLIPSFQRRAVRSLTRHIRAISAVGIPYSSLAVKFLMVAPLVREPPLGVFLCAGGLYLRKQHSLYFVQIADHDR